MSLSYQAYPKKKWQGVTRFCRRRLVPLEIWWRPRQAYPHNKVQNLLVVHFAEPPSVPSDFRRATRVFMTDRSSPPQQEESKKPCIVVDSIHDKMRVVVEEKLFDTLLDRFLLPKWSAAELIRYLSFRKSTGWTYSQIARIVGTIDTKQSNWSRSDQDRFIELFNNRPTHKLFTFDEMTLLASNCFELEKNPVFTATEIENAIDVTVKAVQEVYTSTQ